MPGRKKTTRSVNEASRGKEKANLVAWPFGWVSTATMSVRHGLPGITTENMAEVVELCERGIESASRFGGVGKTTGAFG